MPLLTDQAQCLIDRFASEDYAEGFALTFYYAGNDITAALHNMTRQMLVPFARDYIKLRKSKNRDRRASDVVREKRARRPKGLCGARS